MATTTMKVEIIHKETLKPSSSTPYNLKNFKLCLIDQLAPTMYIPLILFYPHVNNGVDEVEKKTQLLKTTLSETLTLFYPLAGRIKTHDSIVCNNEGVEFFKAQANFPLSKILEKPNTYFLRKFLPAEPESIQARTGTLLLVQVTFFQCGGMAIGISSSHKIVDAWTLSAFLKSWTSMAVFGSEHALVPEFNAAELLPHLMTFNRWKRFQESAGRAAVSSIIWKSVAKASRSNKGFMKTSVFAQTVNIRARTSPPLSENLAGNFFGISPEKLDENENGDDLKVLVAKLRKALEEVKEFFGKKGLDVEGVKQAMLKGG
ncbi:stemmadenine O-acetyltransferase [Ziziphus jujuba]|uniref:Stemmadenine O-acetyltransferase n=1 Tax=Ziziphus jujuba TaxID=326968 RepID=A0A6P4AMW7_ZIZJJ|nr:stemmadenine O-acetyltransferase [Ziziphus jujuba]